MHIIIVDNGGSVLARRYITVARLPMWLQRNAPANARCDVYSDSVEQGGEKLATLRCDGDRHWVSFAAV